jgi:protein phosphatase
VPITIQVAGRSDVGLVRTGNEDNFLIDEKKHLFAVCDGMGGHQAGEVASQLAVDTVRTVFDRYFEKLLGDPQLSIGRTVPPQGDLLLKSIRLANRRITNMAMDDPSKAGMGTTIVAIAFEADIASIAHVGDSRAYRLGDNALEPLTRDHSWVAEIQESQKLTSEEANQLVGKNIITRALGVRENVEVDLRIAKVRAGEIFILCSDGLCGFADDQEIFAAANPIRDDIHKITDTLIQMANDRGGNDNVTVVTIKIIETAESPLPELEAFTLAAESAAVLTAEDTWLDRMEQEAAQSAADDTARPTVEKKNSSLLVISIFAAFAVIAALIIYLSQQP